MSLNFLQTLGLAENEAKVYQILLKTGAAPASVVVHESKLKRPNVYKILSTLEQKGLVLTSTAEKVIRFIPESPTKLLELAEAKYQEMEQARADLRATLPQLSSAYITSVEKPVVTTYEGVKGLKEIYEDTLKEGKKIYALLKPVDVEPELYKWLTTTYIKKRKRLKISAQVIVATAYGTNEYIKKSPEEYRFTATVPGERFPFQHEICLYGDKIAFINYKTGENLIGIVIKHPTIAKTMKAWFDLAWEGASNF